MAPLARSSLWAATVCQAFASETCAASGTCAEDTTLLQLNHLKNAIRHEAAAKTGVAAKTKVAAKKTKTADWPQYEVDRSKCNNNVNMVYVADQEECEALATTNGHPFYSFRHNGQTAGHKCMSSADCGEDALIGDRTNEWNIYGTPGFWALAGSNVYCSTRCEASGGVCAQDADHVIEATNTEAELGAIMTSLGVTCTDYRTVGASVPAAPMIDVRTTNIGQCLPRTEGNPRCDVTFGGFERLCWCQGEEDDTASLLAKSKGHQKK